MTDKRAILASKRARNLRKKAQRASAKAIVAEVVKDISVHSPEFDSGNFTPTDASSGDEDANERAPRVALVATTTSESEAMEEQPSDNQLAIDDDCSDDEEDELVFVCRPLVQDFCTEFVPSAETCTPLQIAAALKNGEASKFTVRIPAFRETHGGYTTYTVQVTTLGDTSKQFQIERRYSEFVAFANALDEYLPSSEYQALKQRHSQDTSSDSDNNHDVSFRWELPPKTWFRMTQTTALEDRRSKLEWSLQSLLAHEPKLMCAVPLVRDFLMLDVFGVQVVDEKMQCV